MLCDQGIDCCVLEIEKYAVFIEITDDEGGCSRNITMQEYKQWINYIEINFIIQVNNTILQGNIRVLTWPKKKKKKGFQRKEVHFLVYIYK